MTERDSGSEIVDSQLKQAYESFRSLSREYGSQPSDNMDLPTNGRVFKLPIPSEIGESHPDFISGRYYGPDTRKMEIQYRLGDKETKVQLSLDTHGKVTLEHYYIFEVRHIHGKKDSYSLFPIKDQITPDLESLNGLLIKAEEILTGQREAYQEMPERQLDKKARLDRALNFGRIHDRRLQEEKQRKTSNSKRRPLGR